MSAILRPQFFGARFKLTSPILASPNATTPIPFDTVVYDVGAFRDAAHHSRFLVPNGGAGRYRVGASISYDGSVIGATNSLGHYVTFVVNGVAGSPYYGWEGTRPGGVGAYSANLNPNLIVDLNVGDYIEAWYYQVSGVNENIKVPSAMWLARVK